MAENPAAAPSVAEPAMSLEDTIEHAKRAFALKKYEQAVEHYASALELVYVTRLLRVRAPHEPH